MFTKQQFEISLLFFSHKFLSNLIVFKVLNITGEPCLLRAGADHGSGAFLKPSSTFPDTSVDSSLARPFTHPPILFYLSTPKPFLIGILSILTPPTAIC